MFTLPAIALPPQTAFIQSITSLRDSDHPTWKTLPSTSWEDGTWHITVNGNESRLIINERDGADCKQFGCVGEAPRNSRLFLAHTVNGKYVLYSYADFPANGTRSTLNTERQPITPELKAKYQYLLDEGDKLLKETVAHYSSQGFAIATDNNPSPPVQQTANPSSGKQTNPPPGKQASNATPSVKSDPTPGEETLTNQSVVKMVKSGLSANLIVQVIQKQPSNFVLAPSNLIQLKQQGVPESVVSAMLATQHPSRPQPSPANATLERSSDTSTTGHDVWQIQKNVDRMNDSSSITALMQQPAIGNENEGIIQVLASCPSNALDFKIVFLSIHKQPEYGFLRGGLARVAWFKVRLDKNPPQDVADINQYKNWANVTFSRKPLIANKDLMGASPGTIAEALAANTILIQVPIENGDTVILEINPQEASFRRFIASCGITP